MDILQKKNTYMKENEIKLLDRETCSFKVRVCHIYWSKINSKLFLPNAIVFLVCFSYRSLVKAIGIGKSLVSSRDFFFVREFVRELVVKNFHSVKGS